MFTLLKKIKLLKTEKPSVKTNLYIERPTFAIGDIHGCLSALTNLLDAIVDDIKSTDIKPDIIFLGDYIDRGANSKEVIQKIVDITATSFDGLANKVIPLFGNHEQAILKFLKEPEFGKKWMDYGGAPALRSYGVEPPSLSENIESWSDARDKLKQLMPSEHIKFIQELIYYHISGDYIFVHAGLYPGIPIEQQEYSDMLMIREPFLSHSKPFEKFVIHGHTPNEEPVIKSNRICIDTGTYATNVLTAIKVTNEGKKIISRRG